VLAVEAFDIGHLRAVYEASGSRTWTELAPDRSTVASRSRWGVIGWRDRTVGEAAMATDPRTVGAPAASAAATLAPRSS